MPCSRRLSPISGLAPMSPAFRVIPGANCLCSNQSHIYSNICAKLGCDPTVVSKGMGGTRTLIHKRNARTHTHRYTRTHAHTRTRTHTRMHTHTYTYTHAPTHTRTHAYTRTHARTYARTHRDKGTLQLYTVDYSDTDGLYVIYYILDTRQRYQKC